MKRLLFPTLAALLACAMSQVKADPLVSATHGTSTLEANARLVTDAPKAQYYYQRSSSNGADVTVGSTHYASYATTLTTPSTLTVDWYFRNTVQAQIVSSGSATITVVAGQKWEISAYLEHTENLSFQQNYQAVASSTLNDNDPTYSTLPYAFETRRFNVFYN